MRHCPKENFFTKTSDLYLYISFAVFLLIVSPAVLQAQTTQLKGEIKDSIAKTVPAKAVISLLHTSDSVLYTFTRSTTNGLFALKNIEPGRYILMVTYPLYADYVEEIELPQQNGSKTIYITPRATLLDEVILKQSAMRLRGDTTEYYADSFYLKPNATVEDLLKQLPGLQVDRNGNIIAQGKQIEKILIDGEEFFSDDPTVATKNIRADAIKKVQVFDKKSDKSEFTGVDDGNTTKTLNLQLKESAKKGYFGKLSAGALDEYYNTQAVINSFRAKRQLSAFIVASTTNETGFSSDSEAGSYGFGKDNVTVDEGSGTIFINSSSKNDFDAGSFEGEGLPTSIKGGLHYSNKFANDKLKTTGNYLFNNISVDKKSDLLRQTFLEDSVYYNVEKAKAHSNNTFNGLKTRFDIDIDSGTSIMVDAKGKISRFDSDTKFNSEVLDGNQKLTNESIRRTIIKGDNSDFNFKALFKKKFKKQGRTMTINVKHGFFEETAKNSLLSSTKYTPSLSPYSLDTVDQQKESLHSNDYTQTQLTFTEKLSEHSFLEFNYSWFNLNALEDRHTFTKNREDKYTVPVDSLTNKFNYSYNIHAGGLRYSLNFPKTNLSAGGRLTNTGYQNKIFKTALKGSSNSVYFSPSGILSHKFNANRFLKITYEEQIQQPQMHQLQPVANNNDPVNIFIGNPNLKQQVEKNLQINFSNYQMLKERYLFLTSIISFTPNMISIDYRTDEKGRKITKYVNADGFMAVLAGGYNFKPEGTKMRLGVTPSITYATFSNFVNGQENISKLWFSSVRFTLGYYADKFSVESFISPQNNFIKYSINKEDVTNLTNFKSSTFLTWNLPAKMEAGADLNIFLRQKITSNEKSYNVVLLNAYLEKKFLKSEVLALRFTVNDILNQNKGYIRNVYSMYTEERNYTTFKRYGLLSLTYNFIKGGKSTTQDDTIKL